MKIKSIRITQFRRFDDLTITDLPPAKLVVLAGPNGAGKSSLFDALLLGNAARTQGMNWDGTYHSRKDGPTQWQNNITIEFHQPGQHQKNSVYIRTAYRNDPDFNLTGLGRQGDATEERRFWRMIDTDSTVSKNYQRLASDALEDVFAREAGTTTIADYREKVIGDLKASILKLFPDLVLNTLGNPLENGTFRFDKGNQAGFDYKNLSGGEKAAFDLILDMVVKRRAFNDTVFAIDEPEAHMNTRLQGKLLEELLNLIPEGSQVWVATHSIGMMRKARELYEADPSQVAFLDFGSHDFDKPVILTPIAPTRAFWARVLHVALDDLAELVAPRQVVICEGNPSGPVPGKNTDHDARCYDTIFTDEFPDVVFVSAGGAKEVADDRLKFAAVMPKVVKGITVTRVIDRDDHAPADVAEFNKAGIGVLRRRHIEAYLYDDEILQKLYDSYGRNADFPAAKVAFDQALIDSVARGNPKDDIKSAAPIIHQHIKKDLALVAAGNDPLAFARNVLVPLVTPDTKVYQELRMGIFGK
jgi:predicted ATPase